MVSRMLYGGKTEDISGTRWAADTEQSIYSVAQKTELVVEKVLNIYGRSM